MIYKISTKELFSDEEVFIKKLHCPHLIKWQEMNKIKGRSEKACQICEKNVYDTETMSDEQVVDLIARDSQACLKINPNQRNIKVMNIYD